MATSLIPEPNQNPSTTTNDNSSTTPPVDQTLAQVINEEPVVNTPPATPSADLAALWQNVAQDNARRAQEAERRLQLLEQQQQQQQSAPPPAEELRDQYFANPVQVMRQEMQNIVAPINTQMQQFKRVIGIMSNSQQFKYLRIPDFYNWFVGQAANIQQVTEQTLSALYASIVGTIAMQQPAVLGQMEAMFQPQVPQAPQNNTPTQQQPPIPRAQNHGNNPQVTTPPHLRPNSGNAPNPVQTPQRDYTENEKRLMREQNLTPAQFDALLGAPATVADWRSRITPPGNK
jgi:hypothetical protein